MAKDPDAKKPEWELRAFHQIHCPPFKPFAAMAQRKIDGVIYMVNAEGNTQEEAFENLRRRLKEYD